MCRIEGTQIEQRHAEQPGSQFSNLAGSDQALLHQVLYQRQLMAGSLVPGLHGDPLVEQAGSDQLPANAGEGSGIVHEVFPGSRYAKLEHANSTGA